jgi:hypothetical protein
MKLKEKIEQVSIKKGMRNQLETIADDYAIAFAEWIRFNVIEVSKGWQFDGKFYNDEQLLKIFKEEKGL